MTREEAITRIKDHIEIHRYHERNAVKIFEALDMAIKALEQEPCEDAVSREAVTDVIRHSDIFSTWYEMDDTDDIVAEVIDEARKQLVDDVNELPSVTPKCPECDDAVSREAAIDAALSAFSRGLLASPAIRKLPSAQPEPQWIPVSERLPKVGHSVLFSRRSMDTREGCLQADGKWWQYRWNEILNADQVTAWMPLPEPYRVERRTDEGD